MPAQDNPTFGEFVRSKRMEKKIGLRQFAAQVGVSPTYISLVERDDFAPPTEDRVRRMAEILEEDADEMLALANRLPSDLPEIIREHPKDMATFLRTAKGLTTEQIRQLTDQARKLHSK